MGYSLEQTRANALAFMKMVVFYIRACGITHRFYFQTDWWTEFGVPFIRVWKELQNNIFEELNVNLLRIRKSRWTDNAYVERTHRTDEFYIPTIPSIHTIDDFFKYALGYLVCFNIKRPHYGKFMTCLTPWERLNKINPKIPKSICHRLFLIVYHQVICFYITR